MKLIIPNNIADIMNNLERNGYEAYLIGGCVRDSVLGIKPNDYDIATSALPDQVLNVFYDYKVIKTGLKHGTVTVISEDESIEITTFRTEGKYNDFRRPEQVVFSCRLEDDLSRRDFTINSLAYNDRAGIIDIYGGLNDLINKRISCVGKPDIRFSEDALRIMRALRFAAVLGFKPDKKVSAAIHELKYLLTNISAERISKELELLICGCNASDILIEYSDVISEIIPEVKKCIGFKQHSKYHIYDVWMHIAKSLENSIPDREVRLALLLHDISKPDCFILDEDDNGHFPKHDIMSSYTAETILGRLRFDKKTIRNVTELIKYHDVKIFNNKIFVKRLLSILGVKNFYKLMEVIKGDNSAKHSDCANRITIIEAMKVHANQIIKSNECISILDLNIKGNDISSLGAEGKKIGEILSYLLEQVIIENINNEYNVLLLSAKKKLMEF